MNKLFSLILLLFPFALQAQTSFDSKMKKDTTVDVSGLNFNVIKGVSKSEVFRRTNSNYSGGAFIKPDLKGEQMKTSGVFRANPSVKVTKGEKNGLPRMIEFKRNSSNQRKGNINKDSSSKNFLKELNPYLYTSNKSNFKVYEQGKGKAKLNQTYKGIDFYGKEIVLHFNEAGEGTTFNGIYSTCDFELDTIANLSQDKVLKLVIENLYSKTKVKELTDKEKEFFHYTGPAIRRVIFEAEDYVVTYYLAYEIEIKPNVLETWKYIVDADNGKVLSAYSILCSVDGAQTATATDLNGISRTIDTYLEGTQYTLVNAAKSMYNATTQEGVIITVDAQNTPASQYAEITSANNTWNDPASISAHYNAGVAYDYFWSKHERVSINADSGSIISFVNVSDENGQGMDNAYWNGQAIFYGNGDVAFSPLAGALDVAGHEMTHGVVQNTANLEYYDESGAINESMADIFGFMMDSTNWQIGEEVVNPAYFPSGALRDLQNPHNGGNSLADDGFQPMHVSEQYFGPADNRGVHINSGISNHAFYLLATSAGKSKAANIFYKALSEYLTRYSKFIDLRIACIQSAKVLFGESGPEVLKTEQAFDAVGIVGGNSTVVTTTLPVNPGQDYLLSVDTYPSNPNTIYRSSTTGTQYYALSQKEIVSHPSITDDGLTAVYVAGDSKIYSLDLSNPSVPVETLVQGQAMWDNVAISKDGKRLAAVTMDQDTSIYVYDFASEIWTRFYLYNPTFSSGIKSGGPVYADALEWDYTGEVILYDAFNSLTNISGSNIEYWDVNFIKVWDNALNDTANGEVQKLFSNLPEGISIGNPTFSKNSPFVIAYDYIDEVYGAYAILGFDMENNRQGVIIENNTLGWPSYSKLDDKLAFTYYTNASTGVLREAVGVIDMNPDKVSSSATFLTASIDYAQWGVFYTMGTRDLIINGTKDKVINEKTHVHAYPNPFENSFTLKSVAHTIKEVLLYDAKGALVISQKVDSFEETIETGNLNAGIYLIMVLVDGTYQSFKMIKQ